MAAGGSSLFEVEIAKYLLEGKELKVVAAGKIYLGFCEVESKKAADFATMKELEGTTGYKERLAINAAALKMEAKEQAGVLGEAGKGARLINSAESKIFTAVPGTVTNPKVKFAFLARHTSSKFAEGELLHMIPVSPTVEILSTTTEFSFATGELNFELL
jgi:ATPase subunit of ABC transporter with duplicated ATPase domains